MTKEKKIYTLDDLLEKAFKYMKEEEIERVKKAYSYAFEKHEGAYRKTGDDYIQHPLSVAVILTSIYADCASIEASLLHDVLIETDTTKEALSLVFGADVVHLVIGVTKLSRIHFSTENDYLIEYYKKIVVGMSEDVRVIIIKLAERLHNMRTLFALPSELQKEKAKETLEIFAPIAHHLGIHRIKSELEDLALRYLKPDVFYDIAERLNNTKLERDHTVFEMQEEVTSVLLEHHIPHEIKGRAKSIYSIYNKLNNGKKFSDIYDLMALRVLVETEQECYLALGIIHSRFRPYPKRFKDYIAMPKPNGYQSLHTTVFGIDGCLFEIQIRTHQMNEIAENGVASHWAYKEKKDAKESSQNTTEQKLQFFKAIIELSENQMSKEDFLSSMQEDVLNDNIYVYTPKGDVFEMAKGATPIDFAYRVHTRVGETMVGAMVNDMIVPLNYELQDNDVVKINTNKNSVGPSKEWLHIAKLNQTRNKIRAFFSKSEKEIYMERGRDALEKELRRRKVAFNEFFTDENTKLLIEQFKVEDLEELYLTVGNGKTAAATLINALLKKEENIVLKPKTILKIGENEADIIVAGIDKVKVSLAACCSPIPGDDIIGYITKGNGITVHRSNCHNLAKLSDRTVAVAWNDDTTKRYLATIMIYTNTTNNKLLDILQKASQFDVVIDKMITTSKLDQIVYELDVYVKSVEKVEKMLLALSYLPYIDRVERIIR